MTDKTDPAEIGAEKPHISPSQMETHDLCGIMYENKYRLHLPRTVSVPLIIGSTTHTSAERDLRNMMDTGLLLPDEEVRDNARDAFGEKWVTSGDILFSEKEKEAGSRGTFGAAIDLSVALATLHHEELAPNLFPTHLEHKFRLVVKGYPYDIVGILDIREEVEGHRPGTDANDPDTLEMAVNVRDLKTKASAPAQQVADRSEQLTVYAMWERQAHGRAPDAVMIDALVKTKVPKLVTRTSTRNDYDFETFLLRMERFCIALEKGAFVPTDPTHWICTPQWCGYYDDCPFGRRKRVQI